MKAAREAVLAAGRGEISMSEARSYVALLERLGGMQGYLVLDDLKAELDGLKAGRDRGTGRVPAISQLGWGTKAVGREAS